MEQHTDSPAPAPTPSAASLEADLNPIPQPENALVPGSPSAALATGDDDGAPPPDGYNPAEYRWVPVRRRPRTDGWTEEKQRRFIEHLADTGLVSAAAKAVGMSRESAARLKRSPHGAAFARAWDAARHHAGGTVEDIAFERAIEGVEHNIYDEHGEVVCTKRVHNDRLLMFLLRHLKPERYGAKAAAQPAMVTEPAPPPEIALETTLKALEPPLPAPPEQLLDVETLADELELADIADGELPHFLNEQRPPKTAARAEAEARAAQEARGAAALDKSERGEELSRQEFADMCFHLDPSGRVERSRKRYR
jgi:hypothetical protein